MSVLRRKQNNVMASAELFRGNPSVLVITISPGDQSMTFQKLLMLGAAAVAFSAQSGLAASCSTDIDRAWVELNAQIQARAGAGRSAPQSTIAMMHRQPTRGSIAAAEQV